jgi:S-adenosylmethionine:tRNA ribosyltransferase-isomerase
VKTSDFDYDLPAELIAQAPVEPRDASRLLVLNRATGQIVHHQFSDLPNYLRPGDLLVGNDSRVIPARLRGIKPSGGAVEILLLRPASPPAWECLVRGKGMRPGISLAILGDGAVATANATVMAETESGGRLIEFDPPVEGWLWQAGQVPLPPYIHESLRDPERYQTVYSRIEGSVASSTAGLHFTPELLVRLRDNGVQLAFVTLHISLDTFRPVQTEEIEHHRIHREWASLSADTARIVNATRLAGGRVIAIGTTVVRVLESAAKRALDIQPCQDDSEATACAWQTVASFVGETDLFIRPGHRFRAVDVLITNYHLPKSTLLMLVSAFAGKALIEEAYAEAIREKYRFYSFGDAMLII